MSIHISSKPSHSQCKASSIKPHPTFTRAIPIVFLKQISGPILRKNYLFRGNLLYHSFPSLNKPSTSGAHWNMISRKTTTSRNYSNRNVIFKSKISNSEGVLPSMRITHPKNFRNRSRMTIEKKQTLLLNSGKFCIQTGPPLSNALSPWNYQTLSFSHLPLTNKFVCQ